MKGYLDVTGFVAPFGEEIKQGIFSRNIKLGKKKGGGLFHKAEQRHRLYRDE